MAWVRVLPLPFCWHFYTKYCILYIEHLQMVSFTIINAIDLKTYRQDGLVEWTTGYRHQSLLWRGFKPNSCHFGDILYKVLLTLFWTPSHGISFHHPCNCPHSIQTGWPSGLRRWFKALVTRVALVGVPFPSLCWHSYTKSYFQYFEQPQDGI